MQKLRQASSFFFALLRGSSPFRYDVTADVGTMEKKQDEGNATNWRMSGWPSSLLSTSTAALD